MGLIRASDGTGLEASGLLRSNRQFVPILDSGGGQEMGLLEKQPVHLGNDMLPKWTDLHFGAIFYNLSQKKR